MIRQEDILARINVLPALPDSVVRLSALVNDENTSVEDIENAVRPDPSLTANLLRVSNSAIYKRSKTVDSVRQAIAVLGERRVFEMALADSISKLIPDPLPGYDIPSRQFWMHNVAVAVFAERLGRLLDIPDTDSIFTLGLLHDVGKLVIGAFLADYAGNLTNRLRSSSVTLLEVERSELGTDHTEVGERIARRWNLPETIADVTRWHHDPDNAAAATQQMVDLVHIADSLSYTIGFGNDVGEMSRRVQRQPIERLGVTTAQLEHVASDTLEQVLEMSSVFSSQQGGQ